MTAPMSAIDSPRLSCNSSLRRTIGVPPSSATPTSNEIRVRVEGCSKIRATDLPASASGAGPGPLVLQLAGPLQQPIETVGDLLAGDEVAVPAHGSAAPYS